MSRRKTPRLYGIGCKFAFPGAIILDGRLKPDRPRVVGVVRWCPLNAGYVLCPFVKRAFVFRTSFPQYFKSPQRAWEWLTHHTTDWTYGKYQTSWRPLTEPVLRNRKRIRFLTDIRLRRTLGQLLLAGICAFWKPESMLLGVLVKVGTIGLVLSAALDTFCLWTDYFKK